MKSYTIYSCVIPELLDSITVLEQLKDKALKSQDSSEENLYKTQISELTKELTNMGVKMTEVPIVEEQTYVVFDTMIAHFTNNKDDKTHRRSLKELQNRITPEYSVRSNNNFPLNGGSLHQVRHDFCNLNYDPARMELICEALKRQSSSYDMKEHELALEIATYMTPLNRYIEDIKSHYPWFDVTKFNKRNLPLYVSLKKLKEVTTLYESYRISANRAIKMIYDLIRSDEFDSKEKFDTEMVDEVHDMIDRNFMTKSEANKQMKKVMGGAKSPIGILKHIDVSPHMSFYFRSMLSYTDDQNAYQTICFPKDLTRDELLNTLKVMSSSLEKLSDTN